MDAMKILGSLLSSGALSRGSGSSVLGSVIGAMTGGSPPTGGTSGGGLGGMVGSMLGGGRSGGGGMGDLLGGLLGGGARSAGGGGGAGGGLGDLIGMAMQQFGAARQGNAEQGRAQLHENMPAGRDLHDADRQATLLIKAMINAAKADGKIDSGEQQRIVERLGEVTQDEIDFVRREFQSPLDVAGFAREIPRGMEQQVYLVSLMAIDLDSNPEAQYLHQLAQASGLDVGIVNGIHDKVGAPHIYR
ncbi:MAG: DUF533 domain-containing protein [Chromatiaceae bacterium]|nr:DUF533 domain-containing protein [Chromatiaceae bacterium]MCP5306675.1 DUF533 domain-containing protein [Chromatiaceae bacterium]MCP5421824.1 DUF533 domain-containing protein [Chromatiaceae bacterium]